VPNWDFKVPLCAKLLQNFKGDKKEVIQKKNQEKKKIFRSKKSLISMLIALHQIIHFLRIYEFEFAYLQLFQDD